MGDRGVLLRLLCRLSSLKSLVLRALNLASRLAQLLFCLAELALELLQFGLKITDLALDLVDSIARSLLCPGRQWYCAGAQRNQDAAFETPPAIVDPHIPSPPA
ncbi:MAG TPA: hypothetical protein VMS01_06535 [Stellaceae bacterium]|nr:hypothetical protein [Stellaceae bacterium]